MATARQELGRIGEDAAAAFLESCGYEILKRNVRRRDAEIDIIAGRQDVLAFVEVKTRRSSLYGEPAEAVTRRKQQKIRGLAMELLAGGMHAPIVRFDVIEVRYRDGVAVIRHMEGVF